MRRRRRKRIGNVHPNAESEHYDWHPGMSHIQIGWVDAETGETFSMSLWQPTALLDKIRMKDYELLEQQPPMRPVPKLKTNVIDQQPYRDEKELLELSRKLMSILDR